jgi:hypothetical protein
VHFYEKIRIERVSKQEIQYHKLTMIMRSGNPNLTGVFLGQHGGIKTEESSDRETKYIVGAIPDCTACRVFHYDRGRRNLPSVLGTGPLV